MEIREILKRMKEGTLEISTFTIRFNKGVWEQKENDTWVYATEEVKNLVSEFMKNRGKLSC